MKKLKKAPSPPPHLTADEKSKFRELARQAIEGPGLCRADAVLLELAAVSYCKWLDCKKDVDSNGLVVTVETTAGEKQVPNPAAASMHRFHAEHVRRLLDLRLIRVQVKAPKILQPKPRMKSPAAAKLARLRLRVHQP